MKKLKRKMRKIKKRDTLSGRVENFEKKEKETEKDLEEIRNVEDIKVDSEEIKIEDLRVDSDKEIEDGGGAIEDSKLEKKEVISDYDKRVSDFEKMDSDKIKNLKVQRNIFIALFFLLLFLLVK